MNIEQWQDLVDSKVPDFDMVDGELMAFSDAFMHPLIGTEGTDHRHLGGYWQRHRGKASHCTAQLLIPYSQTWTLQELERHQTEIEQD